MKKVFLIAAALTMVCAGSAFAQPPGVNLSWDDCNASLALGLNKTSTCTSNTEAQKSLYGSFVLQADAPALSGNAISLDIQTNSGTLPCWWNFTVAPRNTGYSMDFLACATNAFDYWSTIPGGAAGGPAAFLQPNNSVPRIRIVANFAVSADEVQPVPQSTGEIYSFTIRLKHGATVGACTGCLTSACFVLNRIFVTNKDAPAQDLTTPSSRNFVFWQGGAIATPGCPAAVPVQNKTWGSVKTLYR